jgi:hypothetical protein
MLVSLLVLVEWRTSNDTSIYQCGRKGCYIVDSLKFSSCRRGIRTPLIFLNKKARRAATRRKLKGINNVASLPATLINA